MKKSRNMTMIIVVGVAIAGIWLLTKKSSATVKPPGDEGENIMASWISKISLGQADSIELLTYPENPLSGKYILITSVTEGQTWSTPESLKVFLDNGWSVLPYPYGQ